MTLFPKMTVLALASLGLALAANTAFADRQGGGGPHGGAAFFQPADFAAMDADADGKITAAEMDAFRSAKIAAADTDGDGFLSAEEMQAMAMAQMQMRAKAGAERMLDRFDADKDGKVSLAEMEPRSDTERMVDRLDTDNDGAVSEAELAAAKDGMQKRMDGKRGGKDGGGKGGKHGRGHGRN